MKLFIPIALRSALVAPTYDRFVAGVCPQTGTTTGPRWSPLIT